MDTLGLNPIADYVSPGTYSPILTANDDFLSAFVGLFAEAFHAGQTVFARSKRCDVSGTTSDRRDRFFISHLLRRKCGSPTQC